MRYLWTLTYALASPSVEAMQHDWSNFRRRCREHHGMLNTAWCRTHERGKRNTNRLHVHFGTPERLEHAAVLETWGHGGVRFTDHGATNRGGRAASSVAGYISGYMGGAKEGLGSRTYDVARGFQPVQHEVSVSSLKHGRELVVNTFAPDGVEYSWSSASAEKWDGPECEFFMWERA